ncbi:MAG: DUF3791 domain-containing protein [Bacteroides oleiciplenus]|jgi:hypothetical protein|uniref:DUF3791 domain-containing protein n=1 Tax=uncultured Bacteroides sp. TaxID=162156 RepID=UPI00095E9C0E|nr:DUF3791 domain-containing protein [uncultured Bacteroides sp.]OKZ07205.1 MAG: DUF3791 domain-containing protein [Bacteroides oleiciplenus]
MNEILLWRKIARIIMMLAERLEIEPERALGVFYDSDVCTMIHDPRYGLHLMSDAYVVDEIMLELQRKQG